MTFTGILNFVPLILATQETNYINQVLYFEKYISAFCNDVKLMKCELQMVTDKKKQNEQKLR